MASNEKSPYVIRAELHCHEKSNRLLYAPFIYDSVQTVEEILNKCIEKDIKILSITSHETLNGYFKAKEIIEKKNLPIVLIPGSEITTKSGHILALGINEEINAGLSLEETIERIHHQGGIAIAAHPYLVYFGIGDKAKQYKFDAVEVYNSSIPFFPSKALNKAKKLAHDMNLPATAGSDAHNSIHMGYGNTCFKKNVITVSDVIKAIKEGDFEVNFKHTSIIPLFVKHIIRNFTG